jgi:translation initiation factor 1
MGKKRKADNNGMVYSTNPDFEFDYSTEEVETLPKNQQNLRVIIDKKNRKGKVVSLITGFVGIDNDLKELGKLVKTKCGVGGSVKDNEIIIQGDFVAKIKDILVKEGYNVKG